MLSYWMRCNIENRQPFNSIIAEKGEALVAWEFACVVARNVCRLSHVRLSCFEITEGGIVSSICVLLLLL
jgi:hypothetical protein